MWSLKINDKDNRYLEKTSGEVAAELTYDGKHLTKLAYVVVKVMYNQSFPSALADLLLWTL